MILHLALGLLTSVGNQKIQTSKKVRTLKNELFVKKFEGHRQDHRLHCVIAALLLQAIFSAGCNQVKFASTAMAPKNNTGFSEPLPLPDVPPLPTSTPVPPGTQPQIQAAALNYGALVGVPLNIPKAEILKAVTLPPGTSLGSISVAQPPSGTLSNNGDHFTFLASALGNVSFPYTVTDSTGAQASNLITVKVLNPGYATSSFYACGNGRLYVLSSDNGSLQDSMDTTYLGNQIFFNDLTIDANGEMYAKDLNNGIYKLDATTGVATQVMPPIPNSNGQLSGLTLLPNGNLATVKQDGTVISINIKTRQVSTVVTSNYTMYGGDLKALPDNYIYWTVSNSSSQKCRLYLGAGNQTLVRIDVTTGAVMEVGCLDQPDIFGVGFARGTIYGFTGTGKVVQVNIKTAKTTVLSSPGYQFWGASSNPLLW